MLYVAYETTGGVMRQLPPYGFTTQSEAVGYAQSYAANTIPTLTPVSVPPTFTVVDPLGYVAWACAVVRGTDRPWAVVASPLGWATT
jgi:hypothetical protein